MSDFDKEAEREKLREKFEKEEEQRAATEQMSELLLKGATMTNAHCSDCGDPIFRYDGQEFCPTCQKPITREQGASADGTDDEAGQSADGDHIEVANPSDEARVQFGADEADDSEAEEARTDEQDTNSKAVSETNHVGRNEPDRGTDAQTAPPREVPSADPERTPDEAGGNRETDDRRPADRQSHTAGRRSVGRDGRAGRRANPDVSTRTERATGDVRADLDAAASLLAETVRRFAERAAAADDPREAREHLAAAREAAEALDAAKR
ncbi:Sjogren's syndrome/scleroderma autoantigen 1 family protein [Haloarcula pellucida]|uniref:Sjogren's syndrome/scleroderma autoantigen 1 (Autoantigen p27) n=1 Tax=Haloarcula pellucida TaxID=1427151 RepID=A0A830GSE4_9EURY|nr:Sjogren's syndrome/scleroderma autoantigen 1 family protein [Halomicroarcula pellucida]MBX0349449.1 hypothetical protein [Halomicroarcula pellucida]GGO02883.1 hypothetical protein GCM10009030_37920 [Halomicroarcula pellucida]